MLQQPDDPVAVMIAVFHQVIIKRAAVGVKIIMAFYYDGIDQLASAGDQPHHLAQKPIQMVFPQHRKGMAESVFSQVVYELQPVSPPYLFVPIV